MVKNKVSSEQLNEAKRRTDNLSYAVKAEIQYFDDERVKDTTSLIANFLKLQIASHQKAVASLQGALQSMVDIYGHDVGDDLARGSEGAFHALSQFDAVKNFAFLRVKWPVRCLLEFWRKWLQRCEAKIAKRRSVSIYLTF